VSGEQSDDLNIMMDTELSMRMLTQWKSSGADGELQNSENISRQSKNQVTTPRQNSTLSIRKHISDYNLFVTEFNTM